MLHTHTKTNVTHTHLDECYTHTLRLQTTFSSVCQFDFPLTGDLTLSEVLFLAVKRGGESVGDCKKWWGHSPSLNYTYAFSCSKDQVSFHVFHNEDFKHSFDRRGQTGV